MIEPVTHATSNAPSEANPARIAPLAVLPVFFKLKGKRVVLAGGSAGAAWKAELLAASGAMVEVYAPDPGEEMLEIAEEHKYTIRLLRRPWSYDVLAGAAMAIGGIETDEEGQAFRCAAKFAGVPVNVVDRPAFCDFSFGAIVNRSPLIIGISTDGAVPVLGQAVRARIDALLPLGFQRWAQAARDWRNTVKASGLSFSARRNFWRMFTTHAVANPNSHPSDAQREVWLGQADSDEVTARGKGSVVFVGIGDGDAEMLTMKAVRMLQTADAVVFDEGVPGQILDLVRREARKMAVPAGDLSVGLIIETAKAGSRVVRLVAGGAGRNSMDLEIQAVNDAGLQVEIVPGI